ncbi:chromosomal replication initiator protein DnaA [Candidatus Saccharibacteria bacterium]|nr:chromosomal replication initiator protein DnaA [Candidatus Saccharibacteria bacterium]MCL1963354.1 chromosomal replication initiator protein DnaA [Candidatus Saccharibacteria bacterium]
MEKEQIGALWQTILNEAELTMPRATFVTWFKPTEVIELDGETLRLAVNNIFAKNQFEKKFDSKIRKIMKDNGFTAPIVEYIIKGKKTTGSEESIKIDGMKAVKNTAKAKSNPTGLNPKYRFDNFVVGGCNDLAHAASQAAAAMPGKKYNPIFIYGNSGLGKTHLIQAIGNEVLEKFPDKSVLYVTAETFGNEYIDFVRFKKDRNFSSKYRGVDVLIIDDIQFIAGKTKTQEEFFNTFNSLHQTDKQIVISADRPPAEIPDLADRLKTRFQMGMTIDVGMPDYETRCAIINTKAQASGIELTPDIVDFLANNIQTNIRELEGALNQILAYCEMRRDTPTMDLAIGLIGNIRNSRPKHITAKQIIDKTANYFDLKADELKSPARNKHITEPRQIAMYLLRSELKMSFPNIARELGRSDHTTAIHSINKMELEIKLDSMRREQISTIRERLYV